MNTSKKNLVKRLSKELEEQKPQIESNFQDLNKSLSNKLYELLGEEKAIELYLFNDYLLELQANKFNTLEKGETKKKEIEKYIDGLNISSSILRRNLDKDVIDLIEE